MEALFVVISIGWVVFSLISRGLRAANQSGQRNRPGQAPPQGARPRPPYRPPLTPTVRPGETGAPDWADIMTMLGGGAQTQAQQPTAEEGVSTESSFPSGSLTSPSMMEGSPSMLEGPGMMDGGVPMMDEDRPGYEGAPAPGAETPTAPPLRPDAQPRRYDPAAMRSAVVWAEILAKPKSLRRVGRVAR